MRSKERLLTAIRGGEVDPVPFSPFLAYWWDFAPSSVTCNGQFAFLRELGADPLLRGFQTSFTNSDILGLEEDMYNVSDDFPGCQIIRQTNSTEKKVTWSTPVGELTLVRTYSPAGKTWMVSHHPIQQKEDYKTLLYLVENMSIQPFYQPVIDELAEAGEDGLSVPLISPFRKTPFQALIEHFVGTIKLVYDLYDFPELIEEVLEAMNQRAREAVEISINGPAEAFITWEDSSTMNTNPQTFRKYIASELSEWGNRLHEAGKILIHHACGHVKDLLPEIAEERVDALESICPPLTGNTEIWEAQKVLSRKGISVIGGIDPVKFQEYDIPALEGYVKGILNKTSKKGFVLANSDSCPPNVTIEKFKKVVAIVQHHSN